MARVLSGIQPTGDVHLGNYLGALLNWVAFQDDYDAYYCIVDLHALTADFDPQTLAAKTFDAACLLLASGLDPDRCAVFVQSHVPQHPRLTWLLECTASYGELRRMTQFKDKAADQEQASAGLLTYPVLMAADILLYDADEVPVGDDQRQHLELTRDLAQRFNRRYGDTFVIPKAAVPKHGARVMDLQEPTRKMSKSVSSPQGSLLVLDPPEVITRKIKRAVTDAGTDVRYDPAAQPGVANLLELLAAASGAGEPAELAEHYSNYGSLKSAVAEAVVAALTPVQDRYRDLVADRGHVASVLHEGAAKAEAVAGPTLDRAMRAIGFLPPT